MSYVRWGQDGSDLYVYYSAQRYYLCAGCPDASPGTSGTSCQTPEGMAAHVARHREAGLCVPAYVEAAILNGETEMAMLIAADGG